MKVVVNFEKTEVVNTNQIGTVKVLMLKGEKGDRGASGDYDTLENKPSINSVQLNGNKTAYDLGLATPSDISSAIAPKADQSDLDALETVVDSKATIKHREIDCKIDSVTQYGRSKNFDVTGIQKILSANFVYNNDLYYFFIDDGIVPVLCVRPTEKTITIFCTGGTSNTSRTLKVRLAYIPTDA